MSDHTSSVLITDQGRRVLLRLHGRHFELRQEDLRSLLGLPPGPPGLGITLEHNRFRFEFVADNQCIEISTEQLRRRLAQRLTKKS
jgi:hypothetical protein